jgi:hypothetical protein
MNLLQSRVDNCQTLLLLPVVERNVVVKSVIKSLYQVVKAVELVVSQSRSGDDYDVRDEVNSSTVSKRVGTGGTTHGKVVC